MLSERCLTFMERLAKQPGASEEQLLRLQSDLGIELPADYLDALRFSNGAEGDLGGTEFWLQLWPACEVLTAIEGYRIRETAPGLVPIATDGGGTLFGIDARSRDPQRMDYVQFDPVNLGWGQEEFRCTTFTDFLEHIAT